MLTYEQSGVNIDEGNRAVSLIKNKINGIGIIFPTIQIGIAFTAGIFRSDAARRPPRSSKIGIMEMMNTAPSGEINCERWVENHCTSTSIVPPSYFRYSVKNSISFFISSSVPMVIRRWLSILSFGKYLT